MRWDMVETPPDILVTNYSMLNAMLMRDHEEAVFEKTRAWLDASTTNVFTLVVDELHLYRGTQGSEVAMVVRNLLGWLAGAGLPAASSASPPAPRSPRTLRPRLPGAVLRLPARRSSSRPRCRNSRLCSSLPTRLHPAVWLPGQDLSAGPAAACVDPEAGAPERPRPR